MAGEPFRFHQIFQVAHDCQLHCATQRFNQIASQTGTAAPQLVNDADRGIEAGSKALPLDGMVEKSVAVVERGVNRMGGLAMLAFKKVSRECREIARPEEAGIAG